jgi:hypothetical protein
MCQSSVYPHGKYILSNAFDAARIKFKQNEARQFINYSVEPACAMQKKLKISLSSGMRCQCSEADYVYVSVCNDHSGEQSVHHFNSDD